MEPQTDTTQQVPAPTLAPEKHSAGPLVGTLIILVLLVLGGIYFMNVERTGVSEEDQLPLILGNDDAEGLPPTSSSDDVAAIEADISATDLDALEAQIDADLQAIDSSL